ncbi:hypothetical protein QJQ45_025027 [Haematococcus lacustris]|nr:hypothetical protein QJQ45_025027 [Haematococcus lacustris]
MRLKTRDKLVVRSSHLPHGGLGVVGLGQVQQQIEPVAKVVHVPLLPPGSRSTRQAGFDKQPGLQPQTDVLGPVSAPAGSLHAALYGSRAGKPSGLPGNASTALFRSFDEVPASKAALAQGTLVQGMPAHDAAVLVENACWQRDVVQDITGAGAAGAGGARLQLSHTPAMLGSDISSAAKTTTQYSTYCQGTANIDLQDVIMQAAVNASKQAQHHASAQAASAPAATALQGGVAAQPNANALYQQRPHGLDPTAAGLVCKDQDMHPVASHAHHNAAPQTHHYGQGAAQDAMQLSPEHRGLGSEPSSLGATGDSSRGGTQGTSCDSNQSTSARLTCEELGAAGRGHSHCHSLGAYAQARRGDIQYLPVPLESKLFQLGSRFGFTAFSIALGSSYFQRLVATMPHLEYAVRCSGPAYAYYLDCLPLCSDRRLALLHEQFKAQYSSASEVTEDSTLCSIQFTCVYLATKIVDRMPMLEMMRYILTYLYGSTVSKAQAYDVESKCLEGLNFRLGPYFVGDELADEDWSYGCS